MEEASVDKMVEQGKSFFSFFSVFSSYFCCYTSFEVIYIFSLKFACPFLFVREYYGAEVNISVSRYQTESGSWQVIGHQRYFTKINHYFFLYIPFFYGLIQPVQWVAFVQLYLLARRSYTLKIVYLFRSINL